MEPLLDNLTLAPGAQLFELDPPHYTSSYGRRTEAIFKHNVPPAPMLIAPDNGLILYERVISTKVEHQMLDKLTKPKVCHPGPEAGPLRPSGPRPARTNTQCLCLPLDHIVLSSHSKHSQRRERWVTRHSP
ncbi:hypothetical protein Vretimale_9238 [Volvox reticuliferus]|uniref:Uncharacterized protein n=1 Tax=Volvox reticuliferus TaxID=1737510 RepID=A0A8J4GCY7_9CHLO|nr:hypothetical protein Vretimale_9238 [Volvox reticuliferus]